MKKSIFKKNLLQLTAGTILSTMLLTSTVFASTGSVDVNSGTLNVRSAASTSSSVISKLKKGETVDLVGEDNKFYVIDVDGVERYVSKKYIDVTEADSVVVVESARVKSDATSEAPPIGTIKQGETYTVIAKAGDWYKINYKGTTGYVEADTLEVEFADGLVDQGNSEKTNYGIVTGDDVNFRLEPSADSEVSTVLPKDAVVDVISVDNDGWVEVKVDDTSGYVSSDYLQVEYGIMPTLSSSSSEGEEIAAYAQKYVGTRYVSGGTTLGKGVDCSGFTYAVYRDFGYKLNRVSSDQYNNGTRVSKSELQPGDLVFFDTSGSNNGRISHVGLYVGNGQFAHASTSRARVIISSLSESYYVNSYVGATRIID